MKSVMALLKDLPRNHRVTKYYSVILVSVVMSCLFWSMNTYTEGKAFFMFIQQTVPNRTKEVSLNYWFEGVANDLTTVTNPIRFIYQAIPYYKNKSLNLGMYNEEVAGYFHMPETSDLLNLEEENSYKPVLPTPQKQVISTEKLKDVQYLKKNIFMGGDGQLQIDEPLLSQWNFEKLANTPIRIDETIEGPKVLIFHTHSKEKYEGEAKEDKGIVAVGEALEKLLEEKYGIETLHVDESFYPNEKSEDTTGAYERMEPIITKVLKENPSIQIAIDLHRDGVKDQSVKLVGNYKGKEAAKIMFVNGLCQKQDEAGNVIPMKMLTNDYLEENLAFSVQAQIEGMKYYPELMRKIYLKPYRYSLHMLPYSILVEVGANTNTPEEAVRAAEPIADILTKVLEKD